MQAAAYGDLDFVRRIIADGIIDSNYLEDVFPGGATCAAHQNHLSVVKWFLSFASEECDPSLVMFAAAGNGHIEVVRWLFDRYSRLRNVDLFHEDDLDCFRHPGDDLDLRPKTAIDLAVCHGHLGIVQYLYEADAMARKKSEGRHGVILSTVKVYDSSYGWCSC